MKCGLHGKDGQRVKEVEISASFNSTEVNDPVLHQVLKGYRANRRQGTHATKTRSLVSGGGRKPFRQKGTGNARQGSIRSPLMRGGAAAHGPQPRDYRQAMNKRLRHLALKVALSDRFEAGTCLLLEGISFDSFSTKKVVELLKNLGISGSCLFVVDQENQFFLKSANNIHGVVVAQSREVNAENILRSKNIVLTEGSLEILEKRLGTEAKAS